MTTILFLIILAVLVFVHELGHFIIAKISGIRVDEFGIGFPPRIFSFKRGETRYSLNLIPFGGFVKIFGEDPNEESLTGPDSVRSFARKPKSIQVAVLIAGVTFNIIFAWLLISFGFMSGLPAPVGSVSDYAVENPRIVVTSVLPDAPASVAMIKVGDAIVSVSDENEPLKNITVDSLQQFIASHTDKKITFNIDRGNDTLTINLMPVSGIIDGKGAIGISMDMIGTLQLGFFGSLYEGAKLTKDLLSAITKGLWRFAGDAFTGGARLSDVTGPIGIAGLVGDASRLGFVYLLSFTAFISLNLAVINLVPFPALDGGRILFIFIETIKGSPIRPKIANILNASGFCLLIILMLVVTFQDIIKLF